MKLRFRGPNNPGVITLDIPEEITVGMLPMLLEEPFHVNSDQIAIAVGFPPKNIEADAADVMVKDRFKENELLVIKDAGPGGGALKRGRTEGKYVPPCDERSVMMRREVPPDNSCLFHAVSLVSGGGRDGGPALRSRCVEVVLANRDKFNAALLGMRPEEYAAWLAQPSSWGGAIELVILSFLLQVELMVVDLQSNRTETFGADEGYVTRGFVYYTGKHYDALAMVNTITQREQFIFNTRDERPLQSAKTLAATGKKEG
jgi:ubiquitin thioesterase OTU1